MQLQTPSMAFLCLFVKEKWQKVQPVQAHISLKRLSSASGDLAEVQLKILLEQGEGTSAGSELRRNRPEML